MDQLCFKTHVSRIQQAFCCGNKNRVQFQYLFILIINRNTFNYFLNTVVFLLCFDLIKLLCNEMSPAMVIASDLGVYGSFSFTVLKFVNDNGSLGTLLS